MKKMILALMLLLIPSLSHALTNDELWYAGRKWDPATAKFLSTRDTAYKIQGYLPSSSGTFNLGGALVDKAKLSTSIPLKTYEVSKYAGRAPYLLRRGVAIMGPVGSVVGFAMTAKMVYDWAQEDDTNKAYFDGIAPAIPGFDSGTSVGSIGTWMGDTYEVTSISGSGTTAYGPAGLTCTNFVSSPYRCDQLMIKWSIASYFGYKSVNLNKIQTPPAPNAAGADENWWYNELDRGLADPALYPNMEKGIDKAIEARLGDPSKVQTSLTPAEILAGKADAQADQAQQQVQDTVQQQYSAARVRLAAGTGSQAEVDELKRLSDELAAQREAEAAQRAEDAAAAPEDVPNNMYDPSVDIPEKKPIQTLIEGFIASSPVAALVESFSFSVEPGACKESMFTAYDTEYEFDLCPYESQFTIMGGVVLAFAHISALFIIFRKGGE